MGLTANIAFGRQFRRSRERQMSTDLCFCRENSGKVIQISSIGWKTATLLCIKIFLRVLLTNHTLLRHDRSKVCLFFVTTRCWPNSKDFCTCKRFFVFLVCQILTASLFNRSTTKKAKQSGTVVSINHHHLDVFPTYLCTRKSKFVISGKKRSRFFWLFVNFRKCDQAQLIKGYKQFNWINDEMVYEMNHIWIADMKSSGAMIFAVMSAIFAIA